MALQDVYLSLAKLHAKLDKCNKGDHFYQQFRYLWQTNGDKCMYLPLITKNLPIDFIKEELEDLVKQYEAFKHDHPPQS